MRMVSFALLGMLGVGAAGAQPMDIMDRVYAERDLRSLDVDASGDLVTFLSSTYPLAPDPRSQLYLLDLKSGRSTELASDPRMSRVRLAPTGDRVAFLAGGAELKVMSLSDKRIRTVALEGGLVPIDMGWAPDGKRMAVMARAKPQPVVDARANGPLTTVIGLDSSALSQSQYEPTALYVLDVDSGRLDRLSPRTLTLSEFTQYNTAQPSLAWSPDGRHIAFAARDASLQEGNNVDNRDDMYWVEVKSDELHRVKGGQLGELLPRWSPDGSRLAMFSIIGASVYGNDTRILIKDIHDGREWALQSADELIVPFQHPVVWAADGKSLWVMVSRATQLFPVELDVRDGRRLSMLDSTLNVKEFVLSRRSLIGAASAGNIPPQLYRITAGKPWAALPDVPQTKIADVGRIETVTWRSTDDRFQLHGMLALPRSVGESVRYPLVVLLKGGPGSTFTNDFGSLNTANMMGPAFAFTERGYAVFFPNTRASRNYPPAYREAFRHHWGEEFKTDVEPGIEMLIARGLVDGEKMAIGGHSYGAYLTAMALTQTARFKAALTSDGLTNLIEDAYGRYPDFVEFFEYYFQGTYAEMRPELIERSPIMAVDKVRTPLLMRAANKRAGAVTLGNLNGTRQFYGGLRLSNVPCMLLIDNYEGHGITNPAVYREYIRRNLAWVDHFVLGKGPDPRSEAAGVTSQ